LGLIKENETLYRFDRERKLKWSPKPF
jgi:hypothetical protein